MEKFKVAIEAELAKSKADVGGVIVAGQSLSHLIESLRDKGWRRVSEDAIEQAGFRIAKGKVGRWTKAGFEMVQPARVVVAR